METECQSHFFLSPPLVGNQVPRYSGWKQLTNFQKKVGTVLLETKYRYIADGNVIVGELFCTDVLHVGNQVPRYSGWKLALTRGMPSAADVGNQVPRYSGFKTGLLTESNHFIGLSPSVVFITNAWCYTLCTPQQNKSQPARRLGP